MKAICIHLPFRRDRELKFLSGVGSMIEFEWLLAVNKRTQTVVENYSSCVGDLCCRASHAIAWMKSIAYQENVLVLEDDVTTNQEIDWAQMCYECDKFTGNEVLRFGNQIPASLKGRKEPWVKSIDAGMLNGRHWPTHAYVVTPVSAATLLDLHLRIVNPVSVLQMSVDHRLKAWSIAGVVQSHHSTIWSFTQNGARRFSDNDWSGPRKVGAKIISPQPIGRELADRAFSRQWSGPASSHEVNYQCESSKVLAHALEATVTRGTCLMAGGGIGIYPWLLSPHFKKVVTFEPDYNNFKSLVENLKDVKNVEAHNAALGSVSVGPITIDGLELAGLDLLVLDAEGGELQILIGSENSIRKFKPVIMVENVEKTPGQEPDKVRKVREFLAGLGYTHTAKIGTFPKRAPALKTDDLFIYGSHFGI